MEPAIQGVDAIVGPRVLRDRPVYEGFERAHPLLRRMERNGWIAAQKNASRAPHGRINYKLTKTGHEVLKALRVKVRELYDEVA